MTDSVSFGGTNSCIVMHGYGYTLATMESAASNERSNETNSVMDFAATVSGEKRSLRLCESIYLICHPYWHERGGIVSAILVEKHDIVFCICHLKSLSELCVRHGRRIRWSRERVYVVSRR
jgi:hypothetical protein